MIALGWQALALKTPDLQTLAQVPAARLLNTTVEGIAIAAVAWLLLFLVGRQNSGTRFAVWFAALLAIGALPFFAGSGSAVRPAAAWAAHAHVIISTSWAAYLLAAWAVISSILLFRLGFGLWNIRKLQRSCVEVNQETLDAALVDALPRCQFRRGLRICISDRVNVPTAVGFFRPAVLIPAWALTEISIDELKVVLLHELAHLRRWDDWTNLAQKLVKAVFFFHPAVWWIEPRLALEREMACDDMVLADTANPRAYAASLISFAERIRHTKELTLAQAAVSRMRQTSLRIAQILDANRPSATGVWKPVLGVIAVLSIGALVAAPYAPQLIAFQSNAPTALAAPALPAHVTLASASNLRDAHPAAPKTQPGSQLKMIPARWQAGVSAHRNTMKQHPSLLAKAAPNSGAPSEMLVVTQSAQFDASGSAVWTLCVWRVQKGNPARRQLEAAFVMKSI